MDRQSEWITLRRVHAFLKSRGLKATAYELEQEARLKFDYPRVRGLLSRGRWRAADVYVSSFLGDNLTPEASDTLFVIRFERFVRALKRGDRAWAARYYDRSVRPVLANHPYKTTVITDCLNALLASARSLRRDHPDNAWYRERCVIKFMCRIHCNKQLHRCKKSFLHDRFTRYKMEGAFGAFGALGLRRHARRRSTAR